MEDKFNAIVKKFIRERRLVAQERLLLRAEDYEGRETLWDQALEELQDALSEAWNAEIERLVAAGELDEE
jgi:hypothetical protein